MLSSTLSFLCNPQPVVVRPPPRGPRHQRALPPNPPHTHSAHGSYAAPPHGCCGHRASQYSEYELATYPPHYHQHHHLHHHHHGEQRGGEYWRYERQEPAAVLVEHLPHHYAAALPQHAAFVIGGGGDDERYHELAYVDQVQRSLALLKENVRKLSAGPGDGVSKKHHLAAAAAHATVVIEAMAAGKQLRHDDRDHLPVATLFKTIRKQRAQPRYLCAECGSASTTQWRNSPNGMKICNPCGMRLWRSRKRKENAAAANNNDRSSGNDNDNKKQECEQAQPAEDEKDSSSCYDASRGRSNIYNLLN